MDGKTNEQYINQMIRDYDMRYGSTNGVRCMVLGVERLLRLVQSEK